MPSNSFRLGVAAVQLSVDTTDSLGSMAAITGTEAVTTAMTPTTYLLNDIKKKLPVTASPGDINIKIAQVGRDDTNTGYAVGVASDTISVPALAAGKGIQISLANANLPTNAAKAACFAIFMQIGAADFQLADFAFVDASRDFDHMVIARPLLTAPYFTEALLDASTVDDYLGDRTPKGYSYANLSPTTGGVRVTRATDDVEINPDTGPAFRVAVTRSTTVAFSLLSNDILDIVRAAAGNYQKYTSNSVVIEEAAMSLVTAQAVMTGNRPFKLVLPRNAAGFQESRLYLGGLTVNQDQIEEAWTKSAPTPIDYSFQTAVQDRLIVDQHVEIIKRFNV